MASGLLPDIVGLANKATYDLSGAPIAAYHAVDNSFDATKNLLNNAIQGGATASNQQAQEANNSFLGLMRHGPIGNFLLGSTPAPTTPQAAATPGPYPSTHQQAGTTPPPPLTYQQLMNREIQPLINNITSNPNVAPTPSNIPQNKSLSESIAGTLQSMSSDYKTGLDLMLKSSGNITPLQAELKGMADLIAYPVAGLTGQAGAPSGIEGVPFLEQLYAQINNQRSGIAPTTQSSGSGYNSSVNTLLGNSNG